MADFRWTSLGGVLVDGTGDIATTLSAQVFPGAGNCATAQDSTSRSARFPCVTKTGGVALGTSLLSRSMQTAGLLSAPRVPRPTHSPNRDNWTAGDLNATHVTQFIPQNLMTRRKMAVGLELLSSAGRRKPACRRSVRPVQPAISLIEVVQCITSLTRGAAPGNGSRQDA